jgi:hypothetical protein
VPDQPRTQIKPYEFGHGIPNGRCGGGMPGLDEVDAERVKQSRDPLLRLNREENAVALLPFTQCCIKQFHGLETEGSQNVFTAENAEDSTSKAVPQVKTAAKFPGRLLSSPKSNVLSRFSSASSQKLLCLSLSSLLTFRTGDDLEKNLSE